MTVILALGVVVALAGTVLEQALADGADAVEIDVRRTLLRVAGRDTPIREVYYETLRTHDIGAALDPRFLGTRAPTLREAIEVLRGRAEIYVDLKTASGEEKITDTVVELLQAEGVIEQSTILSNHPTVLAERAAMSTSERLLVRLHNWHRW